MMAYLGTLVDARISYITAGNTVITNLKICYLVLVKNKFLRYDRRRDMAFQGLDKNSVVDTSRKIS